MEKDYISNYYISKYNNLLKVTSLYIQNLKDKLYNISVVLDDHKKVEAELIDEYDENLNHYCGLWICLL